MEIKVLKFLLSVLLFSFGCACYSQEIADYVRVEKSKHLLTLFKSGKAIASYHIVLGGSPVGHKEQEGDQKTPEGLYTLDAKNANSSFNKSIHISYPNANDIANANLKGVFPGGAIMIHGQKNGFGWASFITQRLNWTKGCIALSNQDMENLWKNVNVPVQIEIKQ